MSKENYLRLTSTLENLEKLEKKVISSRNKESALKKNIDKQANTILDTENIFNKLGTKVSNFDEKMSKLVVRKSRQVANVDKAEKNLSEFNDEHFQGKDAHTFEVNHSLVKKKSRVEKNSNKRMQRLMINKIIRMVQMRKRWQKKQVMKAVRVMP